MEPIRKITFPFAAQFCEVEVNTLTGEVRLLRFLGAHDSGRVLNRLAYDNQVYGGIVVYDEEPRAFSDDELELAIVYGDQVALAIESARLREHLKEAAAAAERSRLARDLHDSVTQSLYSITLLAEGWKRLENAGLLEETEDPLGELGEIAQQALDRYRNAPVQSFVSILAQRLAVEIATQLLDAS